MYTTRLSRSVRASPAAVYGALVDAAALARWRVPDGMRMVVHELDARPGGRFRISLVRSDGVPGKSAVDADTYQGHFVELVHGERVVEAIEFETDDPTYDGQMTVTTSLVGSEQGTEVVMVQDGVPDAVPPEQNEAGMRMALDNLARLLEA